MTQAGFNLLPGEHPIVTIMFGEAALAVKFADRAARQIGAFKQASHYCEPSLEFLKTLLKTPMSRAAPQPVRIAL